MVSNPFDRQDWRDDTKAVGRTLRSAWEAMKPGGGAIDQAYRRIEQEEKLGDLSSQNIQSRLRSARERNSRDRAYTGGVSNPRQADAAAGYTEANYGTLTTPYSGPGPTTRQHGGMPNVPSMAGVGDAHLQTAAGLAQQMVASGDAIEAKFNQRVNDLRKMYQFSETDRERRMIRRQLAHLEAQRNAGRQVINNVYGKQIAQAEAGAGKMRGRATREGERMGGLFEKAANQSRADTSRIAENFGDTGLGVGGGGVGPLDAMDTAGVIAGMAPIEQAYTERMGNIGAQDVDFLANLMGAEKGAQQGELQRVALQMALQAQMQHDAAVNQRIQQERMQYAGQAGDMWSQGITAGQDARMAGWGAGIDVAGQRSGLQRDNRMADMDAARWLQERQWQTGDRRAEQEWENRTAQRDRRWALEDAGGSGSEGFIPASGEEQVTMFGALLADGNLAGARAIMNSSKVTPWARKQMREQWDAGQGE